MNIVEPNINKVNHTNLGLQLWLLNVCWLFSIVLTALQWQHNTELGNRAKRLIAAYAVGLLVAWLCNTPERLVAILIALASVQAVYVLYYQHKHINTLLSGTIYRAGGTFNFPGGVYVISILTLPLALANALNEKRSSFLFICRQGGVSGSSMEPTYQNGDTVLVWKSYPRDLLKPGNVIILKDTNGDELIKRIAFIRPWRPAPPAGSYPNPNGGRLIPYSYLFTGDDHFFFDRVAKGKIPRPAPDRVIYVLGDNLANSDDSRLSGRSLTSKCWAK